MTTLLMHCIGAFICLILLNRIVNIEIPVEHLMLLSMAALLPDIFDKTLTGTRYPFHSLLISIILLLLFNLAIRYYITNMPSFSSKYPNFTTYLLLGSISFITHPIMDLEGLVPLFYPLNLGAYRFDFQISIIQSVPPQITDFAFEFIREPFDYDVFYDHEGALIATQDILLTFLILSMIVVKGLVQIKTRFMSNIEEDQ
ncbi:MAG: hypothetical protein JSV04_09205 [Candidatus Heimdallarchaeota archaeon]|nr:MAG: hypothetical protein JSV04_09205 [Candidatus Heimdallarchaeota archaeon]